MERGVLSRIEPGERCLNKFQHENGADHDVTMVLQLLIPISICLEPDVPLRGTEHASRDSRRWNVYAHTAK